MIHLGDIAKINGAEVPVVDCITGGSPCQDLSIAGKRAGLAGERSGMYMEQIRVVREMREHDRANGRTGQFIRPRFMVWENVPGAFSSNGGKDFAAVLEEAVKIAEPEAPAVLVPAKGWPTSGCLADLDGKWSIAWRVHDAQFWGVPQRRRRIALVADFGGHAAPEVLFERKGLSWDPKPGEEAGKEAAGGAGNGAAGTNGTYCIQGNCIDRADTAGCNGKGWTEGVCYTLNTIDRPAVCATPIVMATGQANAEILDGISPSLNCNHEQPIVAHAIRAQATDPHREDAATYPVTNGKARRLTPLECERLQGYPDGWTDIPGASDSVRYKALGNSIALPFWFWLLRRISALYERPATLGSLFDGIGGFPLCWERCNGKGTALWASEIEKFPMAVTKLRFGEGT